MLLAIAFLISLLVVFGLILFIPLPLDKKPLYIVTMIAGIIVLFAITMTKLMSVYYGVLVFVGLLFASAILLGKKREWIVKFTTESNTDNRQFNKSFKLDWKEENKGRSIYDEEYIEIYEMKDIVQRQKIQKEQVELDKGNVLPTQLAPIQAIDHDNDMKEQLYTNVITTDMYFDEIKNETNDEIVVKDSNDNKDNNSFDINQNVEVNSPMNDNSALNKFEIEDEELSDDWLNNRLDAMYGTDSNSIENLSEVAATTYPYEDDIVSNRSEVEENTEFEDISKLYFSDERGGNDGTT